MDLKTVTNGTKNVNPILSGLTYTLGIAIIASFIFAVLLYFTSLSDSNLPLITYIVTAVSLLTGGYVSGKRASNKGWYYGGLTGIIYGILLIVISFLGFDLEQLLKDDI